MGLQKCLLLYIDVFFGPFFSIIKSDPTYLGYPATPRSKNRKGPSVQYKHNLIAMQVGKIHYHYPNECNGPQSISLFSYCVLVFDVKDLPIPPNYCGTW